MGMGFQHPNLLGFLACVPAVMVLCYLAYRLRAEARKAYGHPQLIDRRLKAPSKLSEWLFTLGWTTIAGLLAVAVAGPYLMNTPERVPDGSVQAVATLDVSKSMLAEDYRQCMPADYGEKTEAVGPWGSRLDMAKYQIEQIMKALQGNQLGLVNYMGEGFAQADLDTDFSSLRWVLKNWVRAGNAPGGGSDYAHGMKEAIETLKRDLDKNKKQVIILFSDGGFTGKPEELDAVIEEINKMNIKLIVIGIGTPGANAIPVYENNQLKGFLTKKDEGGQDVPVTTSFDEAPLRDLVARTNGAYQHVDADPNSHKLNFNWEDLANIIGGSRVEVRQTPIYHWFVAGAGVILIGLSLIGLILRQKAR